MSEKSTRYSFAWIFFLRRKELKMNKKIHNEVITWFPELKTKIESMFEAGFEQGEKQDFRDLVSDIDVTIEKIIIDKINQFGRDQTILGEESHSETIEVDADHLWCIDPIDGTANMLKQKQDFAVMIAYFEKGEAQLSYIYDVMSDKLFHAVKGEGAFVNGDPIKVGDHQLNNSLISYDAQEYADSPIFDVLKDECFQIRYLGASSADAGRVLEGKFGATYCPVCGPWDRAPLILFAEELGLHLSQVDGSEMTLIGRQNYFLGSADIFNEVQSLVK